MIEFYYYRYEQKSAHPEEEVEEEHRILDTRGNIGKSFRNTTPPAIDQSINQRIMPFNQLINQPTKGIVHFLESPYPWKVIFRKCTDKNKYFLPYNTFSNIYSFKLFIFPNSSIKPLHLKTRFFGKKTFYLFQNTNRKQNIKMQAYFLNILSQTNSKKLNLMMHVRIYYLELDGAGATALSLYACSLGGILHL